MKPQRASRVEIDHIAAAPEAFQEDIRSYLNTISLERGLSRNTEMSYRGDLVQAAHFLKKHGAASWAKVSAKQLTAWLHNLSDQGLTESSQARKLTAVRMLCRHLKRERVRDDDPTELLAGPKIRRKLPQTLSAGDMGKLLAAPSDGDAYSIRDRAMLELFYSSGLRAFRNSPGFRCSRWTSNTASCASSARAQKSGSCRLAARRVMRSQSISPRPGRAW